MKQVILIVCMILLFGCTGQRRNTALVNDTITEIVSFFGNALTIDDSAHVMQQIKEIAEKDTMLSVDGRVLTIGDVGFGINVHGNGVTLISSVQINDPKITPIVLYLTSLYGNPTETGSEEGYYWLDEGIRLRRLHSEESGTAITIQGTGNPPNQQREQAIKR